ncbi:hypothetical protein EV424DRAFT_1351020 [Suillus variegatus]|nr:hypothetical protein EV424DRAFT_1351020 [Suillus variegatus]
MTDGPGGKLFPMEVDGWAEVVGYYADGCIKVDVYEIDGCTSTKSEEVINQSYQVPGASGCLAECGIRGAKLVLPYKKPSSDHQNWSQLYRVPSSEFWDPELNT